MALFGLIAACTATRPPARQPVGALPAGAGRAILEAECLNCHELGALELFSDFYDVGRWRALVLTMRENGARVNDSDVEVLAAYLAEHFGTGADRVPPEGGRR